MFLLTVVKEAAGKSLAFSQIHTQRDGNLCLQPLMHDVSAFSAGQRRKHGHARHHSQQANSASSSLPLL